MTRTPPRRRFASSLALAVAAAVLSGCTQTPAHVAADTAPRSRGSSVAPSTPSAPSDPSAPSAASAPTSDERACAGVEAVIGHLAADTAQWSPTGDPFDAAVSRRIRQRSQELDRQARLARTAAVRAAVHRVAHSFRSVSQAMTTHRRGRVADAITGSRTSYTGLKAACGPH